MAVLPLPAWEERFGGWGVVAVWAGLGLEEGGEGTECEVGVDATGRGRGKSALGGQKTICSMETRMIHKSFYSFLAEKKERAEL